MTNSDVNDIAKVARDVKLELEEQGREAMKCLCSSLQWKPVSRNSWMRLIKSSVIEVSE